MILKLLHLHLLRKPARLVRESLPRYINHLFSFVTPLLLVANLIATLLVGCQAKGGLANISSHSTPTWPSKVRVTQTQDLERAQRPTPPIFITPTQIPQDASSVEFPSVEDYQPQVPTGTVQYVSQSGDTLLAIAAHFGVQLGDINSPTPLAFDSLLAPGQILYLPSPQTEFPIGKRLLPDSEVVFSSPAVGFDSEDYLQEEGGYLSTYREYLVSTGWTSAAEIIERVALENSINPRLLTAVLDYYCNCVRANPSSPLDIDHLLGVTGPKYKGLYRQLGWAANQLSIGYYGWRSGGLTEFPILNSDPEQIPPDLNSGTVALEYLLGSLYDKVGLVRALDEDGGFVSLYTSMFGDPWERAKNAEPFLPTDLTQPPLILPFQTGVVWSYTSGPHKAWDTEGALAALDFAPPSIESGCQPSDAWILAMADGLVTRSEFGEVVLDLDDGTNKSDGLEQTAWAILYMHVETRDRVSAGTHLQAGDPLGHPSCEGGRASGTHVHIARKYNGEWIAADGPIDFIMDGWTVHAGSQPFLGTLTRGDQTVIANPYGAHTSFIQRTIEDLSFELELTKDECLGQCD